MRKRSTRIILIIIIAVILFVMYLLHIRDKNGYLFSRPWYERYRVVTHALGTTQEGDLGTNSLEAFLYNYKRGQRVFEADVQIASDDVCVLRHDWETDLGQGNAFGWTENDKAVPTSQEFLDAPILGKYTPLTLTQWFAIMEEHKDIYFITDTKYSPDVNGQFTAFVKAAVDYGYEDVLDRVIVQIYYKEMYDEVMAVYPFKNFIWTMYYIQWPGSEVVIPFMEENQIPVLVMPYDSWYPGLDQYDSLVNKESIHVYVHTIDEESMAQSYLETVDGIYSDVITEKMIKKWEK